MQSSRWILVGLSVALVLSACAGPQRSGEPTGASQAAPTAPSRTLVMVDRHEPQDLANKINAMGGSIRTKRFFNATLALIDGTGAARPYLAESLPQLNTDSWKVFPDGRMETTYKLRPGLTWHDGHPLTAEDFAFALRVYVHPLLGVFSASPQDQVGEILTPDPRTVVIRWTSLYPEAGILAEDELEPLPRHILEPPFAALEQDPAARDGFLNHPFWNIEYVGAGPYRLERWEQGVQIEGLAFDGHALGKPKIPRLVEKFMRDENTIMANVLAGNLDFATRTTLRTNHGQVLKREWVAANKGSLLFEAHTLLYNLIQFRPEYQKTPALLDVRVRRAMAHGIDKQAILDGLYDGEGFPAQTFISKQEAYFGDLERAIAKYPFDSRQVEQVMGEVGFAKDREGVFASAAGERFRPDFQVLTSADYEKVQIIMTDSWRRSGIEAQPSVLAHELVRDNQARHTFSGIATPGASAGLERTAFVYFTAAQIGTAANRWNGNNRGGWSLPEYERLWDAYNSTLDRSQRDQQVIHAMKLLSDELPSFPLYYNVYVYAVVAALKGPELGTPRTTNYWNVQEWTLG